MLYLHNVTLCLILSHDKLVVFLDILRVSPTSGSVEGGTTISITVNAPLSLYSNEDIKVLVGGKICIRLNANNVSIRRDPHPKHMIQIESGIVFLCVHSLHKIALFELHERIYKLSVLYPLTFTCKIITILLMFAGVPCRDVYIVGAGARESLISCVTGPKPQQRSYYPGKYAYMWMSMHLCYT